MDLKPYTVSNPYPTIDRLGMPEYTNPAQGSAVAQCRRDGGQLFRVTALNERSGNRFGYDLPRYDADRMLHDLRSNPGFAEITFCEL